MVPYLGAGTHTERPARVREMDRSLDRAGVAWRDGRDNYLETDARSLGRLCNVLLRLAVTARDRATAGQTAGGVHGRGTGIELRGTRGHPYGGKRDRAAHAVTPEKVSTKILAVTYYLNGIAPKADTSMTDIVDRKTRSYVMSRIRKKGNRSTELRAIAVLRAHGITGWICHPTHIVGRPDLYFPAQRLAVFLQGCFWHGCSHCSWGKAPKSHHGYWLPKLANNRRRDIRVRRSLQRAGYRTTWIWEHELRTESWLPRLQKRLAAYSI